MPEITELLERTTPRDLPPVDVAALAQRGRHRQARQRATFFAATVAVVLGALTSGVVLLRPGDGTVEQGTGEPVGTWIEGADAPFAPRADAVGGALSDGRVLVWGGANEIVGDNGLRGALEDGGIYDPATDSWELIPPLPAAIEIESATWLAGDRLAVLALTDDLVPDSVWVYDVATGSWISSPQVPVSDAADMRLLWDGEVLALLRLTTSTTPQADADDPPTTLRWHYGSGDDAWETGATAPLTPRTYTGVAFDGSQVAVWGGIWTPSPTEANPGGPVSDGAVYNLRSDEWQLLPDAPLSPRIQASVMWSEGRLFVGGGQATGDEGASAAMADDLAAYDPATGEWETLEPAPDSATRSPDRAPFYELESGFIRSDNWFLTDDGWQQLPQWDMHEMGDAVVAATMGIEPDRDGLFRVEVWRDGRWSPAAEAPFGPRNWGTTVVSGTKLIVIGGHQGYRDDPLNLVGDTWVLDLSED